MAGKEKRKYINYKVDAYFRERFSVQRSRRARDFCTGETCLRALKFARFFIGCSASLCNAVAPWVLSFAEACSVLLLHFLGIRPSKLLHNLDPRDSLHHFKFRLSVDDIVTLVVLRAVILSVAYFVAAMRLYHRLYLYITYTVCAFVVAYSSAKLILLDYRHLKHRAPSIAICIIADVASFVHILAARRTVEWVKRRYQTGLMGMGLGGYDELEEPWNSLGYGLVEDPHKSSSDGGIDFEQDVAVDMIAEADSRFVEVNGLRVHYKEVAAAPGGEEGRVGIVLVHGFGAGTFAWRHIMEPMAMQCQCRVVAFDRPGFGLTSRPKASADFNPYELESQASLVLAFCERVGLEQIVLVAHADGCLLATLAASKACLSRSGCQHFREITMRRETTPMISEPATGNSNGHHARTPSHTELSVILDGSALSSTGTGGTRNAENSTTSTNPPQAQMLHPVGNRSGSKRGSNADIAAQDLNPVVLEVTPEPSLSMQQGNTSYWGLEPKELEPRNGSHAPEVLALGFLHPVMSGAAAPTFARLLARSKLGRSILRPLLRTEIGEVANRRAWYNTDKLTGEVLDLYKAPLRVEGWDMALIETTRLRLELKPNALAQHFAAFMSRPVLVLTGEQDRVVPPSKAEPLALELPSSQLGIIPNCGHLSHEETPAVLLETLVPFCGRVLDSIRR